MNPKRNKQTHAVFVFGYFALEELVAHEIVLAEVKFNLRANLCLRTNKETLFACMYVRGWLRAM